MVDKIFTKIIDNPDLINKLNSNELDSIIKEYPFFQNAQILHLKQLKITDSFKYNSKLKLVAAYTTDRTVLFNFINPFVFNNGNKNIITEKNDFTSQNKNIKLQNTHSFNKNETHSFNQWLQLSVKKPIKRVIKENKKQEIIERFINENPKISKLNKNSISEIKIIEKKQYPKLMTETLAKIYVSQKKYPSAIKAYNILSLKYPEKNSYFALQIKKIKNLQKTK